MDLVKLCPACGEKNPVSEVICRVCMTNLSSVAPTPPDMERARLMEEPKKTEETTRAEPDSSVLTFLRSDGRPISVADGDELGRDGACQELFQDIKTVSRRHAKVTRNGGQWRIEDVGSTNGTWVNDRRLEKGRPCPLSTGDTVKLSLSCELKVI
ncbi:MAG: FHA domain-containing protein [Synergistaceae bacterium]|jgi:pSer/pThr/pTyr-binding forkhead associated (FHA) protein|nr:FHA domain-containing protein [Synergistaceae bacterium]